MEVRLEDVGTAGQWLNTKHLLYQFLVTAVPSPPKGLPRPLNFLWGPQEFLIIQHPKKVWRGPDPAPACSCLLAHSACSRFRHFQSILANRLHHVHFMGNSRLNEIRELVQGHMTMNGGVRGKSRSPGLGSPHYTTNQRGTSGGSHCCGLKFPCEKSWNSRSTSRQRRFWGGESSAGLGEVWKALRSLTAGGVGREPAKEGGEMEAVLDWMTEGLVFIFALNISWVTLT